MDIRLEQLDASGFALDLPASERVGQRSLSLGRVSGLRGALRVDGEVVRISDASADSGAVATLSWPLGSTLVSLGSPAQLSSVGLDLTAPRGGRGQPEMAASVGHLESGGLALATRALELSCAVQGSAISVSLGGGELTARAATLGASAIELASATQVIRGKLSVGELEARSQAGLFTVRASSAAADELVLSSERSTLTLRGLDLDGGFAVKGTDIRVAGAAVAEVELEIAFARRVPEEVDELSVEPELPELEPERADPTPPPGGIPIPAGVDLRDDIVWHDAEALFDLRDLDRLAGNIQLGVGLQAQLPVVGTYSLNRTFKIPIEDGALDFVDVERQLSTLEDAFIDFAVRDGQLVLKRDIPILPTRGKTLVSWPLTPVEQALAQNRVIRLRALPRVQIPRGKRSEKKATIQEIVVDKPHVELTLNPLTGAAAEPQTPPAVSLNRLDTLAVDGNLLFRAAEQRKELDASAVIRGLSLSVRDLAVGSRRLAAAEILIGELRIEFTEWDGFRPLRLVARGKDLSIRELTLRAAPGA